MNLSQVSEFIFNWQLLHSDEYLVMYFMILRVEFKSDIKGNIIEDRQENYRFFCKPYCKCGISSTQVYKSEFQTLLVVLTHFMNSLLIHMHIILISKCSQERCEYFPDPSDHLGPLDPHAQFALDLFKVKCVLQLLSVFLHSYIPTLVLIEHSLSFL